MVEESLTRWVGQVFWLALGFAFLLLLVEGWWPLARQRQPLARRWFANVVAYSATAAVARWLPQLSVLGAAVLAGREGWGLFNRYSAPPFVAIIVSILALDLSGYVVHRLEHRIPVLWRIHRLHHSDPDVDVTTSYRFHPFEVLLRAITKVLVVIAVGLPLVAAMGYVLLSALTSVLSHANVRLPRALDRALGMVVITPGIHLTHHSIDRDDSNSNFSVCLSCWDRLFGTFRAEPTLGHENIRFGVDGRTDEAATSILKMLADPFLPERVPDSSGLQSRTRCSSRNGTACAPNAESAFATTPRSRIARPSRPERCAPRVHDALDSLDERN
jgi:sterol desaturase/sphingolipid hydroxylase (fatty acid hydroxylase superfamily)